MELGVCLHAIACRFGLMSVKTLEIFNMKGSNTGAFEPG